MPSENKAATWPPLGKVTLEQRDANQRHAPRRSATIICNAACLDEQRRVLLLSVVASESTLKALRATLLTDTKIEVAIDLPGQETEDGKVRGGLSCYRAEPLEKGYDFHRVKLLEGLWHGVLIAKAPGFMAALTEESLWQELKSERFTTPIVRAWVPWLLEKLKQEGLAKLRSAGCDPGLLVANDDTLDALVAEGLKTKALRIPKE